MIANSLKDEFVKIYLMKLKRKKKLILSNIKMRKVLQYKMGFVRKKIYLLQIIRIVIIVITKELVCLDAKEHVIFP